MTTPSAASLADAAILELMKIHPKGFDLSLDRILRLLEKLGNPHHQLPPVIHVAGTNGKGSTIALSRAVLEAAGLSVHVHTSPHLVNWHERYRLGQKGGKGQLASDEVLTEAIHRVAEANGGEPITVFEVLSAVTFVLFSEHPADVCLVEVGLGGRFDATNVMEDVAVSIITPVAMDHEAYLGDTLAKITFEKAGIIKRTRPVIIGPQEEEALAVIEKQAGRNRAATTAYGQEFHSEQQDGRFLFHYENGLMDLPLPALAGDHQLQNAATAIAACQAFCEQQGHELTASMMEQAMISVEWPARMQALKNGYFVDHLGPNIRLWLDGGHNPHAGHAIAEALKGMKQADDRTILIAGMLDTKDQQGYFESLSDVVDHVFTVPILSSDAGVTPSHLAHTAQKAGLTAVAMETLEEAIEEAKHSMDKGFVLIGGSLYLAGDALAQNGTPPQ